MSFRVGSIEVTAIHTPGHTPEPGYLITDIGGGADAPMARSQGDFLFVGDVGRRLLETALEF
jgi:hydroxyacylglutathione hydrolase